jgi:hypothetical protein
MRRITIVTFATIVVALMVLSIIPGSIGGNARSNGAFINPSYEMGTTGWTFGRWTDWTPTLSYWNGGLDSSWSTDGRYSYHLWCRPNSVTHARPAAGHPADHAWIEQNVDLTGVDTITCDIKTGRLYLRYQWGPRWDYNFQVLICLDSWSNVLWATQKISGAPSPDEHQTFLDVEVDVSAYNGVHKFIFELRETDNGTNMFGYQFDTWIDNIRTEGGIAADVDLEPTSLNLDSKGNYVQFKIEGFPDDPNYTPRDVDPTTVKVEGVDADLKYGTFNNNRYIGKADRLLVEDAIGAPGEEVEVGISGALNDGTGFVGKATIKAIMN